MIIAALIGALTGFVLAIPPGPIGVATIRMSLDQGMKSTKRFALGSATMDFFYCVLTLFATTAIVRAVDNFFVDYPILLLAFQALVVALIIVYGIVNLRIKKKIIETKELSVESKYPFVNKLIKKGPFFFGIAVALTNVANPTFLPTLAYVTVSVNKMFLHSSAFPALLIFSVAFGVGNFLWLYVLGKTLSHYKRKMSPETLAKIHQFAGITLIGFGTFLGYRVIALTHWSEILKIFFAF